jgi:2-octaprenylphenol hydroxylase
VNHDVIIAGAGMVGGTLACLLAQSGLRTALVEPRPRSAEPPKAYDLRVSAIGIGARRVLGAAGVWPLLDHARLGAFREMHVWDTAGRGSVHFDAAEIGQAQLGWIVENARLVDAIERRLEALGSVAWYRPASVDNLEVDERWATVSMEQARARAALVVAADGSRSRLRDVAGIAVREHAYGQQAVVATVEVSMSHRDTAWQRFLPHGPVAFLPLAGNHCSIV